MATTTILEPQLLTIEEASQVLRLSRAQVYRLCQSGEIPNVKMGRSVRIRRDRLSLWLAERESR